MRRVRLLVGRQGAGRAEELPWTQPWAHAEFSAQAISGAAGPARCGEGPCSRRRARVESSTSHKLLSENQAKVKRQEIITRMMMREGGRE